jgi:myo-inositol-1(or 4)-monophosphatase
MQPAQALALLTDAAVAAGSAALADFRQGAVTTAKVSYKAGDSPVSEADIAANAVLERLLRDAHPAFGWISEEVADTDARLAAECVFVVDPIDGTRAFIAGDPRWSISVALVRAGRPVAGVVHAPALGVTYGGARGCGAFRGGERISCSSRASLADALAAGPRFMLDGIETVARTTLRRADRVPSLALRLVQAADATFDVALASGGAHDWDVAAADVILTEAGAVLLDEGGDPLVYNAPDLRRGALVAGPAVLARAVLAGLGLRS